MGAMKHILEETDELTKLSIKNASKIDAKSFTELITLICDLIQSEPPKLEELDFGSFGGSADQGKQVLEAIYDSEIQVKKLDISTNPQWVESENCF